MAPIPPHTADVEVPSPVEVGGTVHIGHAVDSQPQAADFGSYVTYTLPAGADVPRPILPYDSNRHRAVLVVSAPGAVVAGSGVWIGTQAQCQASPPVGGFLPAGVNFVIQNNGAVWLVGDGTNAMRVTVAVERWS